MSLRLASCIPLLSLIACASQTAPTPHAPQMASAQTVAAEAAPEAPRGKGSFQDRAVSLQVVDERSSMPETTQLTRQLRQMLSERLKMRGAKVMDEAPEKLVVTLREYQTTYDANALVGCVTLAGKLAQAAFLPGETRVRRCASDSLNNSEADSAQLDAVMRAVPSAKDKPGLARALVGSLDELLETLERRVR